MKSYNPRFSTFKPGFALVVTLSLMILLTVIAVGLLSLSSISLRSASSATALAEARANARMALMLALGELQKQTGPDQRITATADIAGDGAGLPTTAGTPPQNDKSVTGISKGLSSVQSGTRFWTGVWKNSNTTNPGSEIFTKTPSPNIVQWLVSGSDASSTGPTILPSGGNYTVGSSGNVSDSTKAVVLAGENTVGTGATDRYVVAPVLGLIDRTTSKPKGRYAWWVGDEGVKAKINMAKTLDDGSYASLTSQRRGWETVAGFGAYPTPSGESQKSLPKVTDLAQTSLLLPSVKGDPLKAVFHSATADSMAVIADTLNGGTKIDLTNILNGALPTSAPSGAGVLNYPRKDSKIILSGDATIDGTMRAPLWDTLKAFHDRSKTLEGGSLIVKNAASVLDVSIAPLVTEFRILMGVRFKPATTGTGFKANPCGKIAIAISNPYSQPLKWNRNLEFEVRNQTPSGNRPSRIWNLGANAVFISSTESAVFNNAIFTIAPSSLVPGEARAYTIAGANLRAIGTGTQRIVINLVPFGSATPSLFTKCVELDSSGVYTTMPSLDVREEWQTTLITVEMRLAGTSSSAEPLRRLERFQLDNGYYSSNIRSYDAAGLASRPDPVPIMCYNFQISQPGVDYLGDQLMPLGYAMGQRSSTLRTYADFNLQATRFSKPIASYNAPPYFMASNNGFAKLPDNPSGQTGTFFTQNLNSPMPWGRSYIGSPKTVLFSVPTQFASLAQFQHADLTGDDVAASIGHQPGNAFANSYATPFVKRALTTQTRKDYELIGAPNKSGATATSRKYYDISYLLNASIWDSYFLSTLPNSSSNAFPVNPSIVRLNPNLESTDLADPIRSSSQLMIDGAFNVNSTDKNAWKAFLGSSKYFKHMADASTPATAAFPRSLEQLDPAAVKPSGDQADSFSGFRRLSDPELDLLAEEIVKQVRLRGPFVSLSHFVNRALADIATQPAMSRSGALQAAIDESGATINFAANKSGFGPNLKAPFDRVTLSESGGAPRADLDGSKTDNRPADKNSDGEPEWAATSTDQNYGTVASIIADRKMLSTLQSEQGYRSTGIPGWLTQADLLQVIGPSITNRSDTFRIRAYGEALDAAGKSVAKAYCEAIVQRTPSYVDPSNEPSVRATNLTNLNKTYGRKYQLVSFRWLSPQEI